MPTVDEHFCLIWYLCILECSSACYLHITRYALTGNYSYLYLYIDLVIYIQLILWSINYVYLFNWFYYEYYTCALHYISIYLCFIWTSFNNLPQTLIVKYAFLHFPCDFRIILLILYDHAVCHNDCTCIMSKCVLSTMFLLSLVLESQQYGNSTDA